MRSINETFIAGEDIPIVDQIKKRDGTTFNGDGYEVVGTACDVLDLETVLFTWSGTIDSSGNIDASIPATTTEDHGGVLVRFEVFCKSGPKRFVSFDGFLKLKVRVTEL